MITIKQFYEKEENLDKILRSLENPELRLWTVEYDDGTIDRNDRRINSTQRLKELLFRRNKLPSKVFASIAKFSNPQKFYGKRHKKACYVIADANMLKSDLLFDCDSEDDFAIAHEDGKTIINFMKKEEDYSLENIRFSGKKGFHLLYRDNNPVVESHPIIRINKTEDKRLELVNRLPELQTIDERHKGICCDQSRVHAALNTVKWSTGNLVKEISEEDFISLSTEELMLKYVERVVRPINNKPMIGDDSILTSIPGKERTTLISRGKIGKQSARICYPSSYFFVDSRVAGVKDMYITVLKFRRGKDELIKRVQKEYNLSDFLKLEYRKIIIYINLKLLSMARVKKVMRYTNPINLSSFLYHMHTWIPITETTDRHGKVIATRPIWKKTIKSKYGQDDTHSRPHARLFNLEYKKMAGDKENKVCKAIIRET